MKAVVWGPNLSISTFSLHVWKSSSSLLSHPTVQISFPPAFFLSLPLLCSWLSYPYPYWLAQCPELLTSSFLFFLFHLIWFVPSRILINKPADLSFFIMWEKESEFSCNFVIRILLSISISFSFSLLHTLSFSLSLPFSTLFFYSVFSDSLNV